MGKIFDTVASVNGAINGVVWGIPMLVLIISTGIYITVRTHFFQIIYAKFVSNATFLAIFKKKSVTKTKDKKAISQFQALSTALAATIGTGNISGVALAIATGGAGAVFWMWLSAFFGMMTNYAENVLGIYYRKKNEIGEWSGGPMYYISEGLKDRKGLRHIAKPLAIIFCIFCVFASFGIGNIAQINNISGSIEGAFGVPPIVTGIVLAFIAGLVVIGGIKRIAMVAEKIVPFMAIIYIIMSVLIIAINFKAIPATFLHIFENAFGYDAIAGGISGVLIKEAITMGFKRGVFSNEAGLGSSVIVHSASDVKEPVVQGMWGIFEVFFDTIIICTLTAFTILTSGALDTGLTGVPLVTSAFSEVFGNFSGGLLSIAITLFAFTTTLGWSFYGTKALEFVFGTKATIPYKFIFTFFTVLSATLDMQLAWDISDTLNGLMALPNLIGVVLLSGTVFKITENYIKRKIKKSDPNLEPMLSAYPDVQLEQAVSLSTEENE